VLPDDGELAGALGAETAGLAAASFFGAVLGAGSEEVDEFDDDSAGAARESVR